MCFCTSRFSFPSIFDDLGFFFFGSMKVPRILIRSTVYDNDNVERLHVKKWKTFFYILVSCGFNSYGACMIPISRGTVVSAEV